MKQYNIIIVFSPDKQFILMCSRRKEPYKGIINFIGGKIEPGENHETAAYRELYEETSITKEVITLTHLMDFSYIKSEILLEVYYGVLTSMVEVSGDENHLMWVDANEDFSDINRFAGEGNIYHIMEYIKRYIL